MQNMFIVIFIIIFTFSIVLFDIRSLSRTGIFLNQIVKIIHNSSICDDSCIVHRNSKRVYF